MHTLHRAYRLAKVLLAAALLAVALPAEAAQVFVRGIVRDSLTNTGIPYASVRIDRGTVGTVADDRGIFELALPDGARRITASSQGYAPKTVPVGTSSLNLYDIYLRPQAQELKEVVVRKQRYTKRGNPAVDFARRLRRSRDLSDPHRNPWYSFDIYERISMGLLNIDTTASGAILRRMPELAEHVDTSEISALPVLNLSVKESSETSFFRRNPRSAKRVVHGTRSRGIDDFADQANVGTLLSDMLREVNLYDGSVALLRNNFVSPLSAIAPDFYRFYLVDSAATVPSSPDPHIALAFYPRNKSTLGFQGHIYVPAEDTTMSIGRVELTTSPQINLNHIKQLKLTQDFDRAPDGSALKTSDYLVLELEVIPGAPGVYVTRKIDYRNHSFERPDSADAIFGRVGQVWADNGAELRDSVFWAAARTMPETDGESHIDSLMVKLRRKKLFYWGERFLHNMETGYWPIGRKDAFEFGPLNTLVSYNSFEGLRLRAGGITTARLNPHLFGRFYGAYGFRDHRWKYGAELEYSFQPKKQHSREFPVHSLRLEHRYDIDRLGSHYLYTNADNFVLSLSRQSDRRFTYLRESRLTYTLELENHFSVEAIAEHLRQEATALVPFRTPDGLSRSHFGMTVFGLRLRYAPGETFFQARSYRIPINDYAPVFEIYHRWAPRAFGSAFGLNRTEISFSKTFGLSLLGTIDLKLSGGHIWDRTVFTELFIPNANLSYTIRPGSFALMNPMEFINSSYVSWHATYELHGALLGLIPGVRKLRLREVVNFSGIYGRLNSRNTPGAANPSLLLFPEGIGAQRMTKPYMELSVGLDNILRILRVDYVWRLNYLNVPYKIDRSGVRIALHFTF